MTTNGEPVRRKTLAEHVADVLNEVGETRVDVGYQDVLSEAYFRSGGSSSLASWYRNRLVTRALAHTKSGQRMFRVRAKVVMYHGIINGPVNLFELREEFRDTTPVDGRSARAMHDREEG